MTAAFTRGTIRWSRSYLADPDPPARLRSPRARQRDVFEMDVFEMRVRPLLGADSAKIAYFLVDALRYEMGRELAQSLEGDFRG